MINLLNCGLFSYSKENQEENQDSILPPKNIGKGYIFAVADGVGSYEGAKEASQISVNFLSTIVTDNEINIGYIFNFIKDNVAELSHINPSLSKASTTLTFCYIDNEKVHIGHVGDTRIYVKKKHKLVQLSKDHTLHQNLLDEGIYTKKELKNINRKNTLTSAISKVVEIEYQELIYSISELIEDDGFLNLYIMSDGAYHFWEKRPKFSIETLNRPIQFASSLQRRIERSGPIDDYSLVAASFSIDLN